MSETATLPPMLEITRRFAASPDAVFDAWVGPSWGEWLPPQGACCRVLRADARAGGDYRIAMTMPDGREIEISGTYREVRRPERLVLTWVGSYSPAETLLTVTFVPDGDGTAMTLRQEFFPDPGLRDGYRIGWDGDGGSLDKLARHLREKTV